MRYCTTILLCCFLATLPLGAQNEMNPTSSYAIPIPAQAVFCGQKVNLVRMDLRERFDREMLAMNYMHSSTLQIIKRANRYFPVIEPILKKNGIPDDMKYLCCIESALNPKALSPSGAAGLWQFMPATARENGLVVNDQIDERYHIEKETQAACQFMKECYELYGDWFLTAAAYNAGKRRITAELERQQANDFFDLWLSEETSRYIFRLITMKIVLEHPQSYGFRLKSADLYQPVAYMETSVEGSVPDWAAFARQHGISYLQLKEANLWLRDGQLDNKQHLIYHVRIPVNESLQFNADRLYVHNPAWVTDYEKKR